MGLGPGHGKHHADGLEEQQFSGAGSQLSQIQAEGVKQNKDKHKEECSHP